MTDTISREKINQRMQNKLPTTIIEVLPKQYFDAEHIPGALNIPHDEITARANAMLPNKNAFIVVYCANADCQNSSIATRTLKQLGYNNTFEYVEGKLHWQQGQLPLVSTQEEDLNE